MSLKQMYQQSYLLMKQVDGSIVFWNFLYGELPSQKITLFANFFFSENKEKNFTHWRRWGREFPGFYW